MATEISRQARRYKTWQYLQNGLVPRIISEYLGVTLATVYSDLEMRRQEFIDEGNWDEEDNELSWVQIARLATCGKVRTLLRLGYSEIAISKMDFGIPGHPLRFSQSTINRMKQSPGWACTGIAIGLHYPVFDIDNKALQPGDYLCRAMGTHRGKDLLGLYSGHLSFVYPVELIDRHDIVSLYCELE